MKRTDLLHVVLALLVIALCISALSRAFARDHYPEIHSTANR